MATITYNNRSAGNATNLITFTDIPNILKVTDSSGGTKQSITFIFNGNLSSVSHTEPWYISLIGETISSVNSYANAINKSFYVSQSNQDTAASAARALRNCPTISATFTIQQNQNQIILKARSIGNFSSPIDTNISSTYLTRSITQGSAYSSLFGSQVNVDIYTGNDYITSLEKYFYNGEVAFDLSPVLTTLAKRGTVNEYNMKLTSISSSGVYSSLGTISSNYITQGYMCNQGRKYLTLSSSAVVAQNYSRGTEKLADNNTILYVYGNTIPISFYKSGSGSQSFSIKYLDSAFNQNGASSDRISLGSNKLHNATLQLSSTLLRDAFYVDVEFGGNTVRYNVIKPLKATEYYQRLYWRNSYGGVSFFDFTGQRSETRDLEIETYQKSIYDYYTDSRNELEKVYDNKVKYTVTLKSHLLENDGKYIFNDLLQSPEVWTKMNDEEYAVIIDSVTVDETDKNNIYEATVKYHYSQEPSLI